jgi:protein gp37
VTSIEWTDDTWNPLRAKMPGDRLGWACIRVSPGCTHCYAATMNKRLGTGLDYTVGALDKVETGIDERALDKPLRWRKPRRVFVCSMTDLFGEWVTDAELDRIFAVMALRRQHTFQVLTKRPARMRDYIAAGASRGVEERVYQTAWEMEPGGVGARTDPPDHPFDWRWPLPNVWLGTSVEDQKRADERIKHLVATPAALRFLSCEPLLGPIDIFDWLRPDLTDSAWANGYAASIGWVIVGGESGPGARPMDIEWARSLVDQCRRARVAVFVKQLGARPFGMPWAPSFHGSAPVERVAMSVSKTVARIELTNEFIQEAEATRAAMLRMKLRDRKGGKPEEWPEDLRVRQWPA